MSKKKAPTKTKPKKKNTTHTGKALSSVAWLQSWAKKTILRRITVAVMLILTIVTVLMYIIGQWYIFSNRNQPITLGATFIPDYARFYGLDAQETFSALIDDLGFEQVRLVSYWSVHEAERGVYDFSELDWQFAMAEEKGVDVSLAIGLRQPRWPECHMPEWASELPKDQWYPALKEYMRATIERYKDSPALKDYQLENEFLLAVFGECPDHDRERLIDEFYFVKSIDPTRPVIVSRSNNAVPSWPINEPRADVVGAAVYKRVWDRTITKRYFEYPLPPWFYSFLAGGAKLTTNRDSVLHELQAEPWLPDGYDMRTASVDELNKSMDAERLRDRFEYGRATGMKTIDLWGAEWWYYRKSQGDDSLWQAARAEINYTKDQNQKLLQSQQ